MPRGQLKGSFQIGLVSLGANLVCGGTAPDEESHRIDEKRFSGPGFTGEHDETGAEGDGQLLDDAEIRNAQLGQHAADSLRLSSAGMLREQRIDQLFELALRACTHKPFDRLAVLEE